MQQEEIYTKFIPIIKPYCKNTDALDSVTGETKILTDLGVNSARLVDIIIAVEDEFDIEIEDEAADGVVTVNDAVAMIHQKIQ